MSCSSTRPSWSTSPSSGSWVSPRYRWNRPGAPPPSPRPAAEPLGPPQRLPRRLRSPCTGNTLGKPAAGVTDSSVTMAAKAHLRNGRPLLIAPSTNDGLSASAAAIGALLARKYIYFVPFGQDDPLHKPTSLVADFTLVPAAAQAALEGYQLQPLLTTP